MFIFGAFNYDFSKRGTTVGVFQIYKVENMLLRPRDLELFKGLHLSGGVARQY